MADKLGLGSEVKELHLGSSFTNARGSAFHTFRYDFKPASVDTSKMATVDILPSNEVNVTVPHCDGAGTAQTSVFRGPKKPYAKECVLIIDHNTGEIVLERLSHNIQLKKTRAEGTGKAGRPASPDLIPPQQQQHQSQSYTQLSKKPSPTLQKSPPSSISYSSATPSPPNYGSPAGAAAVKVSPRPAYGSGAKKTGLSSPHQQQQQQPLHASQNTLMMPGSMPTLDDFGMAPTNEFHEDDAAVGVLSDSSSDSGSDSSSDSSMSDSDDSDPDQNPVPPRPTNGRDSGTMKESASLPILSSASAATPLSMPSHLLSEDLRLSDSGSDSD